MTRNDIPQPRPYDDDPLSHDAAFLRGCAGCEGLSATRQGERCWNCGRVLPGPIGKPTPGAYLITDAQLSDLMEAATLLASATEEPQARRAQELVRGVVQAARKVGA